MKTMNTYMKNFSKVLLLTAIGIAFAGGTSKAQIISDLFNQASSNSWIAPLTGLSPNINAPGGTYAVQGFGFTGEVDSGVGFLGGPVALYGAPGTPVDHAYINGDRATLSLAGFNSGTLTLSAYVAPVAGGGAAGLGFSSAAAGSGSYAFSGLSLDNAGGLYLFQNGTRSGPIAYSGGTFDSSATAYLLSFTIDTSTGALTAISLSGSTADYSSYLGGTTFNTTNTAFLSMDSNIGGDYANLTLTGAATPEPSTLAMMLGGFCLLMGVQYRRFRRN